MSRDETLRIGVSETTNKSSERATNQRFPFSMFIATLQQQLEAAEIERDALRNGLKLFSDAYPPDVFPLLSDDETRAAVAAIYTSGVSSERLHAAWARHIVQYILETVDEEIADWRKAKEEA